MAVSTINLDAVTLVDDHTPAAGMSSMGMGPSGWLEGWVLLPWRRDGNAAVGEGLLGTDDQLCALR